MDHLFLVLLPHWYLSRNTDYALKMVAIPFVHGAVAALVHLLERFERIVSFQIGIFMMWPVKDKPMYNADTVIMEICFLSKSQVQTYNFYHASWQLYGQ